MTNTPIPRSDEWRALGAMPCPFCASPDIEFENTDEVAQLRCRGCGALSGIFFYSQDECESGIGTETESRAVRQWNTRAAIAVQEVQVSKQDKGHLAACGSDSVQAWQSVDTAPPEDVEVLCYWDDSFPMMVGLWNGRCWQDANGAMEEWDAPPSRWQHLPATPAPGSAA